MEPLTLCSKSAFSIQSLRNRVPLEAPSLSPGTQKTLNASPLQACNSTEASLQPTEVFWFLVFPGWGS